MIDHRDSSYLLGLQLESHHRMFSSLLGDTQDPTLRKYNEDINDLLSDLALAAERLKVELPEGTQSGRTGNEESMRFLAKKQAIKFTYTNYRGETSIRNAHPIGVRWGETEWHPEPGMLMTAFDLDKQETREFALKDCDFTNSSNRNEPLSPEEFNDAAERHG